MANHGSNSSRLVESDLQDSKLFRSLSEASRASLSRIGRIRKYSAGQTVIEDDEMPPFIGYIRKGILRMHKTLPDGREHIVGLLIENDIFGRVFDGNSNFAIEAATDVELCCFDRRDLESLLSRDADLERLFLINVLDELDAAREWIMLLGCRRVTERLASFFLILFRRWSAIDGVLSESSGDIRIHVPVSRADLAHYLGTRAETISRAIRNLADRGVIEILGPYDFHILDIEALVAESGNDEFAPEALRL